MRKSQSFKKVQVDPIEMAKRATNPMEAAFYTHRDRIAHKWHHYLAIYDWHLQRFRGQPVRLLELGVSFGGSLQVWKSYFGPQAIIHGIDINPACAHCTEAGITTHIGSQDDPKLLRRVVETMGGLDVVIDDASHVGAHQIISFETLYPLVQENGIYICEDTHTSYWLEFGGGLGKPGTFVEYSKQLVDRLHAWYVEDGEQDESFARATRGISFYDSMVVFEKQPKSEPFHCIVGWRQF